MASSKSSKKRTKKASEPEVIRNLVVVSDLHCGSQLGLCTPVVSLDGGGSYTASPGQLVLYSAWQKFWNEWVPQVTRGEPFAVVINGDSTDGNHHRSTDQISHNLADQQRIAFDLLCPVRDMCDGRLFLVRGTEAHVGPSGENEERLAKALGAIPDENNRFARNELWIQVGEGLVHILHHIGTTGSAHYESSAVMRELTEEYTEAGRNRYAPPDVVVRSHRHRYLKVEVPTADGLGISVTTPGWQLKTNYVFRLAGARISTPQVGGILIRQGDEELHTRAYYESIKRPSPEVVTCPRS